MRREFLDALDGGFEALLFGQHGSKQVAHAGEAVENVAQMETHRCEVGGQFAPGERRRHGRAGMRTDDIGRGDGLAPGELRVIEVNLAFLALGDGARGGEQVGAAAEAEAGDDLGEGAGLLETVDRLERDVNVKAVTTGGFWIARESDLIEDVASEQRCLDDAVEAAVVWIKVEKDEVGIVERTDAAEPRVLIDAPKVREVEEACGVVGED